MEIVYCDVCGFRIPDDDFEDGRAVRTDEKVLCAKCLPKEASPPKVASSPANKKPSGIKISPAANGNSRRSITPASPGPTPAPTHASPSRVHDTAFKHREQAARDKSSNGILVGGAVGVAVLIGIVILVTGGSSKPVRQPEPKPIEQARRDPDPVRRDPEAGRRDPEPVRRNPDPEPGKPLLPGPLRTDDSDAKALAEFDQLLKELQALPAADLASRSKRLEAFAAKHENDLAGSRARIEIGKLGQPGQPEPPVAQAAPPSASSLAITTTPPNTDEFSGLINEALSSYGTKVEGLNKAEVAIDGNFTNYDNAGGFAGVPVPADCVLIFPEAKTITAFCVLLWNKDARWHRYKVSTCEDDGANWKLLADHTTPESKMRGWVVERFEPRKVKKIQLSATFVDATAGGAICIVEMQAFNAPSAIPSPPDPADYSKLANHALASNGATVEGGGRTQQTINDGNLDHDPVNGFGMAMMGTPVVVTLKEPTAINCVRTLLWDMDARWSRYTLETSEDGAAWKLASDRTGPQHYARGWVVDRFDSRTTKFIRFSVTNTNNIYGAHACICEMQAFNVPSPAPVPQTPLTDLGKFTNHALAANGATVFGPINAEAIIDGKTQNYEENAFARVVDGTSATVTLKEPTTLNCIRILLWDKDDRFHQYTMDTSEDGAIWKPVADRSLQQMKGWCTDTFTPRKVKAIRFNAIHCEQALHRASTCVVELQAFNTNSTPAVAPVVPAVPAAVADTAKGGANLIFEDFEKSPVECIFFGEPGTGPAGSTGKVGVLKGSSWTTKIAVADWARMPGQTRVIDSVLTENTRVSTRYYNVSNKDVYVILSVVNDQKLYRTRLDGSKRNVWLNCDCSISDFVQDGTKAKLVPGVHVNMLQILMEDSDKSEGYVDDMRLYNAAPVEAASVAPAAAVAAGGEVPAGSTILLEETFDKPIQCLGAGEIVDGPPGANSKVAMAKGFPTFVKVSLANWARKGGENRNVETTAAENTRIHARYYNVTARDVDLMVHTKTPVGNYKLALDGKSKKSWITVDVPLSDLQDGDGKRLAPGTVIDEYLIAFASGPLECAGFMDDLVIYNPPAGVTTKPNAVAPAPAPATPSVTLLQEKFDKAPIEALSFGEIADGPAGSNGKVLAVKGDNSWAKAGLSTWAKRVTDTHTVEYALSENTRIHLRYYHTNARTIVLQLHNKEDKIYAHSLDASKPNTWIDVDLGISDFLFDGAPLKAGMSVIDTVVGMGGAEQVVGYIDDLLVVNPGAPAAVAPTVIASNVPVAVGDAYSNFLAEYLAVLRKRDSAASLGKLAAAERDPNLKAYADQLKQDRKLAEMLPALDAALLAGAEKLKDADNFDLKLSRGETLKIGKRGKFQVSEVKNNALQLASEGARIPIPLDSVEYQSRDQIAFMGMGSDVQGLAQKAFLMLLKHGDGETAPTLAPLKLAIDAGGAAPEAPSLRRIYEDIAQRQKAIETREAGAATDWRELTKLVDAKKIPAADAAYQDFKKKYESTRFYQRKLEEIKAVAAKVDFTSRLEKGLVAWWKMDEAAGKQVADSSGNNNIATLVNTASWLPQGKVGGALTVDGDTGYAEVADSPSLHVTGALTLAAWVRYEGKSTTDWGRIVAKGWIEAGPPHATYSLHVNDNEQNVPGMLLAGAGREKLELWATTKMENDKWYYIVGVFDPTAKKAVIYVNGVKEAESPTTFTALADSPTPVRIGDDFTMHQHIKGSIDDVRIYKRVLSDDEIQYLANPRKSP